VRSPGLSAWVDLSGRASALCLKLQLPQPNLDLISYNKVIPDACMRRGVRFLTWYLLLVAVLGIMSRCQSLRDPERLARRHHGVLTEVGLELRRPRSDSSFRYFFLQVQVAALCAGIRDWAIAQIPEGASDLVRLICDGKSLRPQGCLKVRSSRAVGGRHPSQRQHCLDVVGQLPKALAD
jgi:hypothetical protein